jgi:hypothetical protein
LNTTPGERQEFTSWKEIADYLGVTVRTAQKWEEERGLPIKRLPGGRARVLADPAELAAWKSAILDKPGRWASLAFLRKYAILTTGLLLLLAAGLLGAYLAVNGRGPPALLRVEQHVLVVSDENGRELWRRAFGWPLAPDNYAAGFQYRRFWFGDLDGDGRVELVFVAVPHIASAEGVPLICFSDKGAEKWRFVPGRTVTTRIETFNPPYTVQNFIVSSVGKGRAPSVIVSSGHYPYYPAQVALLSPQGKLLREYWHSGYLYHIQLADLDRDGSDEIYLAGINNGYKSATMVVLDPDTMGGASVEENLDYQLQGFPAGRERARFLFPRSCLNRKFEDHNFITELLVQAGSITVGVDEARRSSSILYHFTPRLGIEKVVVTHAFHLVHAEMHAAGQLDHRLTPREEAAFHNIRVLVPPPAR